MLGAIDIGTNSTRLLVAKVEKNLVIPVKTELRTTRMGEGLAQTGELSALAMERTCMALREYKTIMGELGVIKFRVVATSAVRDAFNSNKFLHRVLEETGFNIEVISGSEEAALSYSGVARTIPDNEGNYAVVDIGGGSTELIWPDQAGLIQANSLQVGAVRMTENQSTVEEIEALLKPVLNRIRKDKIKRLVGVGGTVTTLAAIIQGLKVYDPSKVQGFVIPLIQAENVLKRLKMMTLDERQQVPGLQPRRADIICAGITILIQVLKGLGVTEIIASEADLLYGIIFDLCD